MKTEHKKNAELRISFLDGKMMEKKGGKDKEWGKYSMYREYSLIH